MAAPHDPESLARLAALVDTLLDAPPERRGALIDELSAGDPARRAELAALLRECEEEPALFRQSATGRFAALFDDAATPFPESLADRYGSARELGRGGMSTVYLARDRKHGRDVAVKVVHPAVAAALGPARFLREIEIVAGLRHPHIVPLYDSGEADGALYYVMPFETGLSLRRRLARDGPLPTDDVVVILRDVCDALAHAHARGIVHRDVKPDNVLLSGRHAMVTDFGVARAATEAAGEPSAPTGIVLGTPAYMAPEQQASDARIDRRTDVYAVGVLGYELLAGRPPFTGAAPRDVLAAHAADAPVPVATHRPDVPPALAALVMRCLQKRPEDRWQSADEMVEQLDALAVARSGAVATRSPRRWWARIGVAAGGVALVALAAAVWRGRASPAAWSERWSAARIERLTDFAGSEVDAAISADGRLVAFLADHDTVFDAFVGAVGGGPFRNLTDGRVPQLFNEDVRNVGFSADAAHVWVRVADIASPASVSMVPSIGGSMRPFLPTAVMVAWSPDGARLAYHETTPGDPIYVADRDGAHPRRVFLGDPGVHSHHLSWSPDGRHLYFAHGLPPDDMDVWRIAATGGSPERITRHHARVAYPSLVDDRTLLYTATADDGTGPWLYAMDLDDRVAHRLSTGVEHYLSVSASAEVAGRPRRLVATISNPSVQLWTVPVASDPSDDVADERAARPLALPTARSAAPRFASDSTLFYLASRGGADGVWRRDRSGATELWKPDRGAVAGAVAISPDGRRLCVPVRHDGRSTLHCLGTDGRGARPVAPSLDVRGTASWSPDGRWIAVAAIDGSALHVFKVPVDGGAPVRLVDTPSFNPVWSPDGGCIVYSGVPRARSAPLRAVRPDGNPYPLPPLLVDRVGDSYRFLPDGRRLVVKLGGFRRQDFWSFDLATGQRRRLTRLRPGESIVRFDVAPDGGHVAFERVRENSDVVLIELPRR